MRLVPVLLLLLLLLAGCEHVRPCRDLTLLLSVTFGAAVADADQIEIDVSVDGSAPKMNPFAHVPGETTGTIEIDFPSGYPEGHSVAITGTATLAGTAHGSGSATVVLPPSCTVLPLEID
jgi:hypothetical protein